MIGFNADFYRPKEHWATAAGPEEFNAAMNGATLQPVAGQQSLWPLALAFALAPLFFLAGFRQGAGRVIKKSDLTDSLIL